MMLETHMKLCVTEPGFLEKHFCPQNMKNGQKNEPRTRFSQKNKPCLSQAKPTFCNF